MVNFDNYYFQYEMIFPKNGKVRETFTKVHWYAADVNS